MKITRRLGSTPQQRGSLNNGTCPDIFELDGAPCADPGVPVVAVIGTDITDELRHRLPADAHWQPGDRIIAVDRRTLHDALKDLP